MVDVLPRSTEPDRAAGSRRAGDRRPGVRPAAWALLALAVLTVAVLAGARTFDSDRPGDGPVSRTRVVTRPPSPLPSSAQQSPTSGSAPSGAPRGLASSAPAAGGSGPATVSPSPRRSPLKIVRPPRPKASPIR
jgi:hypothetical protein